MISAVFIIISLCLIVIGLVQIKRARNVRNWKTTSGKIISSDIDVISNQDFMDMFKPRLSYEYTVNNKSYLASRINFSGENVSDLQRAGKISHSYPQDKTVTARYNPENPAEAILEPTITAIVFFFLIAGIVLLIFTLGLDSLLT